MAMALRPRLGRLEAGRIGLVGDDDGDLAAGEFFLDDIFCDGEEVGAASGEKNAEAFHEVHLSRSQFQSDCCSQFGANPAWARLQVEDVGKFAHLSAADSPQDEAG